MHPLNLSYPTLPSPYPLFGKQGGGQWRQENAVRSAEVAWHLHSHAPVLGQIDRAIAEGAESSPIFGEMLLRRFIG